MHAFDTELLFEPSLTETRVRRGQPEDGECAVSASGQVVGSLGVGDSCAGESVSGESVNISYQVSGATLVGVV